jgi:hydroxymethylpyrimidine pyrophosphatase-like HAD family hydrolase
VVGVGNGPNDVDFLEWVGWSVAVAPLDQELGRAVDEVIEAPDLASWITRHFRL